MDKIINLISKHIDRGLIQVRNPHERLKFTINQRVSFHKNIFEYVISSNCNCETLIKIAHKISEDICINSIYIDKNKNTLSFELYDYL